MKKLKVTTNPKVDEIFNKYPAYVKAKMRLLRQLVIETAKETDDVEALEETLKWGEPSFVTKKGSTLRMDWKPKTPHQYAMYFQCTTRLVETFRLVFGDQFEYEGNRAIVFQLEDEVPIQQLKKCIKASLIYHQVKHMITLGI